MISEFFDFAKIMKYTYNNKQRGVTLSKLLSYMTCSFTVQNTFYGRVLYKWPKVFNKKIENSLILDFILFRKMGWNPYIHKITSEKKNKKYIYLIEYRAGTEIAVCHHLSVDMEIKAHIASILVYSFSRVYIFRFSILKLKIKKINNHRFER